MRLFISLLLLCCFSASAQANSSRQRTFPYVCVERHTPGSAGPAVFNQYIVYDTKGPIARVYEYSRAAEHRLKIVIRGSGYLSMTSSNIDLEIWDIDKKTAQGRVRDKYVGGVNAASIPLDCQRQVLDRRKQ